VAAGNWMKGTRFSRRIPTPFHWAVLVGAVVPEELTRALSRKVLHSVLQVINPRSQSRNLQLQSLNFFFPAGHARTVTHPQSSGRETFFL